MTASTMQEIVKAWLWATRAIKSDEVVHDVIFDHGTYLVRLETEDV
jgi:hypothetical protein